jgi:acetate kinase
MQILVLNTGSSSIKFSIFRVQPDGTPHASPESLDPLRADVLLDGTLSGVGSENACLAITGPGQDVSPEPRRMDAQNADAAIAQVLAAVSDAVRSMKHAPEIDAVGYRVVHPGPHLCGHQRITEDVLRDLDAARVFAPLHDPEALSMIRATMQHFPHLPHFACFDTVFHETMPEEAKTFALPAEVRAQGVHRYGFHGLSCESIVQQIRAAGPVPHRMAIAHLGSGCSVTALLDGSSVDTTMGLTPAGGVVMGTRAGDLDPGLVLYLLREQNGSAQDASNAVESMLNHHAGLVALSEMPNDVQTMRSAAAQGNAKGKLALRVFTRSITKAIGSYAFLLGGLDAIVFAGGIGYIASAPKRRELQCSSSRQRKIV